MNKCRAAQTCFAAFFKREEDCIMDRPTVIKTKYSTIFIARGVLSDSDNVRKLLGHEISGKAMIITDSGVPVQYAKTVFGGLDDAYVEIIPAGEQTKSIDTYAYLCDRLLTLGFCREDCIIAVGGGVVGDIAGFVASTYMRGIDFYNFPTTLLAQVDSSVGGKTALNFRDIKNVIGTFYQPKMTVIDTAVLKTLTFRQMACGYAEALKTGIIGDEKLYEIFKRGSVLNATDEIIERALKVKIKITNRDETDKSVRAALNFGHTIGHAIEASTGMAHGECIGLGMLCMCSDSIYPELCTILRRLGLPTKIDLDETKIADAIMHDKKITHKSISAVFVDKVGSYKIRKTSESDIMVRLSRITAK